MITELGIRPGFASMYDKFERREYFEYGIPEFDKLIQTPECPATYIIFQEQVMATFIYAGFPEDETYGIIKAVAKKDPAVIKGLKSEFFEKMALKGIKEKDIELIWKIIEDNANYSFNSSHSYAVALDSIYGAYLKANYPYEFYEVMLEFYSEKKDNEKVSSIIHEMESHFQIMMGILGFGYDNRRYTADKEKKTIYPSLLGVKFINRDVAEYLYELGKNKDNMNFYQIYENLKLSKTINKRHIETLMKIKYFNEYGSPHKLIRWMTALNENFAKKQYNKERVDEKILQIVRKFAKTETEKLYKDVDIDSLARYIFELLPETEFQVGEQLKHEIELAGKLLSDIPDGCTVGEVVARSWKKDVFLFKSWKNNQEIWINTYTKDNMPNRGDIVLLHSFQVESKRVRGKERKDYTAEVYTLRNGK